MFKRAIPAIIIVAMACFSAFDMAAAQESQVIHFQGLLTGPDGGPLRTDIYDVQFSIWDQESGGVEPIWSETQVVEVTEGLFDVFLGNVNALSADVFTPPEGEGELRYMEIQVEGDDPMAPRTQIAKTPNSFVSSRVLGDVVTGPGSLKLMDPSYPEIAGIDMRVDTTEHNLIFWTPQLPWIPAMEMTANAGATSFKMIDPGDEIVGFDVFIGGEGNSIKMMDPGDEKSLIEMSGGIGGEASFYMFNPQPEPPAVAIGMGSTPYSSASFKMFNTESDASAAVEMSVDQISNKRLFKLGMPPDDQMPAMEMATGIDENSFRIASPVLGGLRDEITDPKFEVYVDAGGGSLNMEDEIGRYMGFEPSPFEPGGIFTMYDPESDIAKFELHCTADGAGIDLKDEIGRYMGLEPMPFYDGGYLKMFDPVTDNTTVVLGSDGSIQARKGTFGNSSNNGDYNLVVGTGSQANGDYNFVGGYEAQSDYNNCFLWADYSEFQHLASSAANQFLVRSTGGVTFYSDANMNYGVYLAPDAFSWSPIIPPGQELNTRPVDGKEILSKIEQLPLRYYSQKNREKAAEHIGPVPGDFNRLFDLVGGDTFISTADQSGVALAAVKELINTIEEQNETIRTLERRIEQLENR